MIALTVCIIGMVLGFALAYPLAFRVHNYYIEKGVWNEVLTVLLPTAIQLAGAIITGAAFTWVAVLLCS